MGKNLFYTLLRQSLGKNIVYYATKIGPPDATFIGLVVAHVSTLFIGLFSFYLVADSIHYDSETSGKILCATPLHSAVYIMGKTAGSLFSLLPLFSIFLHCRI